MDLTASGHVGHQGSSYQHKGRHKQYAETRNIGKATNRRTHAGRCNRSNAEQHATQNTVQGLHEPRQHPDGDRQRQPHHQSGQHVFLEWHRNPRVSGQQNQEPVAADAAPGEGVASALGAAATDSDAAGAAPPFGGVEVLGGVAVLPPLKSVAYQPEPFNWKPAAVTCFLNAFWEQAGQTSSGASDIFCNTSLANPQDSHL